MGNEEKNVEPQDEQKQSMQWKKLDEETIRTQFRSLEKKIREVFPALEQLQKEGDNFSSTEELLKSICETGVGPSGWIQSFIAENISDFPNAAATAKDTDPMPDWYHILLPEERKTYDVVLKYMKDAVMLQPFFQTTTEILNHLLASLADTFRVLLMVNNLKSNELKFDNNEYKKIKSDFEGFARQLSRMWEALEEYAGSSLQYYNSNKDKASPQELKEQYQEKRKHEYRHILEEQRSFIDRVEYVGQNTYALKDPYPIRMRALDNYSKKLIEMKTSPFESELKDHVLKNADPLFDSLLKTVPYKMPAGSGMHSALTGMIDAILVLSKESLEQFKKFKEAPEEAPFCLMRAMTVPSNDTFGFNPKTGDPWSEGTHFEDAYNQGCKAISKQCREYVVDHGKRLQA